MKRTPASTGSGPWPALLLTAWSALAVFFFYHHGGLVCYGDAEAHLNIARRIFDSQTPGYEQLGSPWLPLPHLLMLPFVRYNALWINGLAGAIPSALCFVAAGAFLFASVRRLFGSLAAAWTALALFAANPNALYLQSTAMTEPAFFACLMAVLYFTVRFRETQGWGSVAGAGMAACAGTLARYEGWFLVPFVTVYFLFVARRRRAGVAALFAMLAALGPLYWLAHNWWLTGDALEFYRGPYSARAIQGRASYPGMGDWATALLYVRTAARMCLGPGLLWMGLAGMVVALARRAFWPLVLLALPGVFYVWSVHSAGTPIFVPELWPFTYYNSRYGLAALPLFALASAALVTVAPERLRAIFAALVIAAGTVFWMVHPRPDQWVVWKESQVNSEARRAWTRQAADYLGPLYVRGSGILTSTSDDLLGIFRAAGIPLRETLNEDNRLPFWATVARPDLSLWQEWVVAAGGDPAQSAVNRAGRYGIRYKLEKTIIVPGAPVIEIYRR